MVCPISADDGIGPVVTVDCIAAGSSVDRVIPIIAFDRVIAGPRIENVTLAGAVDGVVTGAPIDYLALVTASRDVVAFRSPINVRRIRYFVRPRAQVVEIVGVCIAAAMDGDR